MSVAIAPNAPFFPKTGLRLPPDEVHVWRMRLDVPVPRMLHMARTLSPAELDRAQRFRSVCDRNRFIARRGVLRQICSAYLAIDAVEIAFGSGPWSKPYVSGEVNRSAMRFSMSCSHMTALYAFARDKEVGVDIERVRSDVDWRSIASLCLSPREIALLQALPVTARTGAFFTLWTRKEAYVKAQGTGLSTPLNRIDVLGRRTHCGVLVRGNGKWQEPWSGSLQDLEVGRHDVAALAIEEQGVTVVHREWS